MENRQKLILVVDDEENIRLLFQKELEDQGFKVMLAESGESALRLLEDVTPDLITIDMRMPTGMDGLEALQRIKEKKKDIPVIICSSYPYYKEEFSSWASEAYIIKTGNMGLDDLKNKIAELLG